MRGQNIEGEKRERERDGDRKEHGGRIEGEGEIYGERKEHGRRIRRGTAYNNAHYLRWEICRAPPTFD